jgi:hypothetical protein
MKVEGWLLLHRAGRYKEQTEAAAFPEFVTEVESQIAAEVGEYIAVAQSAQTRPSPKPPDIAQQPTSSGAGDKLT